MEWWQKQVDKAHAKDLLQYDQGLCYDLQKYLDSLSIGSKMVIPYTPECIHESMAIVFDYYHKLLIACLKVEGQDFDFIDVTRLVFEAKHPRIDYHYGFVIQGICDGALKIVHLKVHRKSLINHEMTGFEWKGDSLAERLNSDTQLKEMLETIYAGSPLFGTITNPVENSWGTTLHIYSLKKEGLTIVWLPVRNPRDFPFQNDMEIVKRIIWNIRAIGSFTFHPV